MADIAAIFHWSLAELDAMPIEDLIAWRKLAAERGGGEQ